jgi:hypothetical protein
MRKEQELRASEGTQVPDPRIMTFMPIVSSDTEYNRSGEL